MPRVAHIAASFAIVLMVYWAYALVAVPLIEPAAEPGPDASSSTAATPAAPGQDGARVKWWAPLFPPDAWEAKDPEVLTIGQVQLLMKGREGYQNQGNGVVFIRPCTIIVTPENAEEPEDQLARSAVLEVPDGAVFKFHQAFDLSKMKIGQFQGGELRGPVTIRRRGKLANGQDNLRVTTRNVKMTAYDITTPEAVDFRMGPHYGRGRNLHMHLMPKEGGSGGNHPGANIGGLEYLEILSMERLHLDMSKPKAPTPPGGTGRPSRGPAAAPAGLDPAGLAGLPLEITCRGPFRFDAVQQKATFQDQVEVMQIHPPGPNDRLTCNLLALFFTKKAGSSGAFDLEPQRIEASGTPAQLTAWTEKADAPGGRVQIEARGERLLYDLQAKSIALGGGQEIFLRRGGDELHARNVHYKEAEAGRLGSAEAQGPGWLRHEVPERPDQQLEVRWNDQLLLRPQGQNQLLSLTGGAELKSQAINRLNADAIHFWLLEKPQGASQPVKLQPDRMLAIGHVKADSPQFSAVVDQLEAWFQQAAPLAGPAAKRAPALAGAGPPGGAGSQTPPGPGAAARQDAAAAPSPKAAAAAPAAKSHMEISGRLLRAEVLLSPDQKAGELSDLTVVDNVRFVETRTALADQRPALITGNWLKVTHANRPDAATACVLGQPAHVEGRGLSLTGSNVNLDSGANRLWIDGPGRMDLPMNRDLEGQQLKTPVNVRVDWQRKMHFDGRNAVFEHSVVASGPTQKLRTEVLEVQLQRPIRFADAKMDKMDQSQIEEIRARGGAFLEDYAFDSQRQLQSYSRMETPDLTVNMRTGALCAGGPGNLTSVRRGTEDLLGGGAAGPLGLVPAARPVRTRAAAGPGAKPRNDQLVCLHVRYQGYITGYVAGDLHHHEVTFHEQVRGAYAPVDSWTASIDTDSPETLGPDGGVLHCDQLSAVDMTPPHSKDAAARDMEFVAAGNAVAEGSDDVFTARAARITYDQKKQLMILEGDGRTDAELYRQQTPGGAVSKAAAQKIWYWQATNSSYIDGAHSLDYDQTPGDTANNRGRSRVPSHPAAPGQ